MFPDSRKEEIDIRGRAMVSGLPRTITVNSKIEEALSESVDVIVQAAKNVLGKYTT